MMVVALFGLEPETWSLVQNVLTIVVLCLLWSVRNVFNLGVLYRSNDHTEKFNSIDRNIIDLREDCNKAILSLRLEYEKAMSDVRGQLNTGNDNYSRLSSFTQSLPDRADRQIRTELKNYVLSAIFVVHIEESRDDRRRIWAEIHSIRRELNEIRSEGK